VQIQIGCPNSLNAWRLRDNGNCQLFNFSSTSIVQLVQHARNVGSKSLVGFDTNLMKSLAWRIQIIALGVRVVAIADSDFNWKMRSLAGPFMEFARCQELSNRNRGSSNFTVKYCEFLELKDTAGCHYFRMDVSCREEVGKVSKISETIKTRAEIEERLLVKLKLVCREGRRSRRRFVCGRHHCRSHPFPRFPFWLAFFFSCP
jgi:hypothetical protein